MFTNKFKKNLNKGFTLVELMTTFVLVAIISTLLIRLVITLKEVYIKGDVKTTLLTKQGVMTDKIYKDLSKNNLTKIESCAETNCVNFVYKDKTKKFIIDKTKKTVTYDNYTIKLGRDGYLGEIALDKYNSDIGSILSFKVPIYNKLTKGDFGVNITYQLDNDIEFDDNIAFDIKITGVTVLFDDNMNLLYGLYNTNGEVTSIRMKYTISNEVVTVTALNDDGYGFTTGRVYLEKNKKYIFNCETDGTWAGSGDTVEAFLMLNGSTSTAYYHMNSNNNYEFTPTVSGEYWLRLDSNQNGKTHRFWNISVKEKKTYETKKVMVGETYGKLPVPEREGYIFKGWTGKNLLSIDEVNAFSFNDGGFIEVVVKPNTNYTLSSDLPGRDDGYANVFLTIDKNNNSTANNGVFPNQPRTINTGTENIIYVGMRDFEQRFDDEAKNYKFMLEEGNQATEYEPYYIKANTKVTQGSNHTLTAIWEKDPNYVPKEYQQVEYIKSTGTQYIDTGVKFNSNVDKFELTYQANDADTNYFIAGSGWQEAGYVWVYSYKGGSRFSTYIKDTDGSQRQFFGFDGPDTSIHKVVYDAKKQYVDDTLTADNTSYTFGETPYNFGLFNSLNSTGYLAKTKIYSFKMWKSGTLVRNMIPVYRKSDNVIGLYDTVEGKFYTNAGTGTFEKGKNTSFAIPKEYQRVEYIGATGTQYILTDVMPSSDFKLTAKVYLPSSAGSGEQTIAGVRFATKGAIEYYYTNGIPRFWLQTDSSSPTLSGANESYGKIINYEAINNSSGMKLNINDNENYSNSNTFNGANQYPLMIFAYNYLGSPNYYFKGRIYNLTLTDNNRIIRNFIPVYRKSDNAIGLYDTVEGKFYTNAGTGTFEKGGNV